LFKTLPAATNIRVIIEVFSGRLDLDLENLAMLGEGAKYAFNLSIRQKSPGMVEASWFYRDRGNAIQLNAVESAVH
jgi:hypothetical protein